MKKNSQSRAESLDKENEYEIRRSINIYKFRYTHLTGQEPDEKLIEKERKRIIKQLSNGKEGIHQAEKEKCQMDCLLNAMRKEKEHLSIKEMSQMLMKSGFTVGASAKTIYRRILPELLNRGAQKDDDNKYYFPEYERNPEYMERSAEYLSNRIETVSIIANFMETIKDSPVYEKAKEYIDEEFKFCHRRSRYEGYGDFDENSLVSRVIFMGAPAASVQNGIWDAIHQAMQENQYINIQYIPEEKKESERYMVQPYQLIYDNGFWDLWGNCTTVGHRGLRLFNLSRIQKIEIIESNESFELPDNYDFRFTLAGNFGCYNDDVIENYSIKFKKDSYAYLYIKDRTWGEFQEIHEVEDGYVLEFEANQYKPILRWVLSWGADVQPLEPQKLVDDWKKTIRDMNKIV